MLLVLTEIALLVGISMLRIAGRYTPADGIGLLFVVPILLAAIEVGIVAGLTVATLASAILLTWTTMNRIPITSTAYIVCAVVFSSAAIVPCLMRRINRQRVERLERQFEFANELMCIVDRQGLLSSLNPAWKRVLGFEPSDLEGMHVRELSAVHERESSDVRIRQLLAPEAVPMQWEQRYRKKSGEHVWLEWSAQPGCDGLIYAAARECGDRRAAQQHRTGLLHHVQGAHEAERKRLAVVLHDRVVQDLVGAVMLNDTIDREALGPSQATALDDQRRSLRLALRAAQELMGEAHPIMLEHASLAELVEHLVASLDKRFGLTSVRDTRYAEEPDEDTKLLILRLLQEFVTNAHQHSGDGSDITIDVRSGTNRVTLRVADTGDGFPMAVNACNMAVPQLHNGINLLLERVRARGGSFLLQSAPGAGTVVAVSLPTGAHSPEPASEWKALSAALR